MEYLLLGFENRLLDSGLAFSALCITQQGSSYGYTQGDH